MTPTPTISMALTAPHPVSFDPGANLKENGLNQSAIATNAPHTRQTSNGRLANPVYDVNTEGDLR